MAHGNLHRFLLDLCLGPYEDTDELIDKIRETGLPILLPQVSLGAIINFKQLIHKNNLLVKLIVEDGR